MRVARFVLAGLLVAAPAAPWLAAAPEEGMKCCPLHRAGAACCAGSCSIGRCAPPAALAFAALPPAVIPERSATIGPATAGNVATQPISPTTFLPPDLPDPPPRA